MKLMGIFFCWNVFRNTKASHLVGLTVHLWVRHCFSVINADSQKSIMLCLLVKNEEKIKQVFLKIPKNKSRYQYSTKSIAEVMSFKYLGENVTCNRNLRAEAQEQRAKAAVNSGYLRVIIWRNKRMTINS